MALKLGELVAVLKADDRTFEKNLGEAKKKFEGFGDKMKVAAAVVGVALMAGVASGMAKESVGDKLAAQLGATPKMSAELGKIAGDLYANAYGESLGQVNEALRGVIQNGAVVEDESTEQIQNITAKVLDLATAFDQDLGQTTRAVGKMIKTGMARDANEALDILTRGFQEGTDQAGDLLDTVSEYSTKFRDIGLSGQQAMGLLSQGLRAGARDADTVADALKEFAIRAVDGSESTAAGMKAIGLNGDKMAKIFAKGGPEAAKALDTVLDRLRNMKDPVARDAAAVQLFGTKAEDLGDALYALDPSSAVDALGRVTGAAERMGNTLNDNAEVRLETFKRKAHAALVEKLAEAIPTIEKIVGWMDKHSAIVGPLAVVLGVLAGAIGIIIGVYKIWTIAQTALNIAMMLNPVALVVIAIIALIAVIVWIATKTDWFQRLWNWAWGGIKAAAKAVGEWFAGPFAGFFVRLWDGITGGVTKAFNWIKNAFLRFTPLGIIISNWGPIKTWIINMWNAVIGFVQGLPGRIRSAAWGMWDGIKDAFRNAINWLIGKWNNFSLTLGGGSVLGMDIPSVTLSTPNIPYLAQGGIVRATRGGRLAVVGEGREDEAVAPLSKLTAMIRDAVREAKAGVNVEHMEVKAFSNRFSLPQVMGELAMHGVH